jgi:hypothetical protein
MSPTWFQDGFTILILRFLALAIAAMADIRAVQNFAHSGCPQLETFWTGGAVKSPLDLVAGGREYRDIGCVSKPSFRG